MDPSFGSSSSSPPQQSLHGHPPRKSSAQSVQGHSEILANRAGDGLKRGHSDGDVLAHRLNERRRPSAESGLRERETWMDFIRGSSGDAPNPLGLSELATSRSAMIIADKRKRIAERQEELSRIKAAANLLVLNSPNGRSRQGSMQTGSNRPSIRPPPSNGIAPTMQRITDRPLPRTPSTAISRERRSREISLPKWQADTEVANCPICGTAFSFWYRKHHCRKCGRVVCGNCSPHRITIPRQFIVHPPEETATSPTTTRSTGVEVVDLTGGNDSGDEIPHPNERPQSSDYKIDPALGGGQEVRLCNPCVPDPNPLPHLPFSPPSISSYDSFPRPDRVPSRQQRPSNPNLTASEDERPQDTARRTSSRSTIPHSSLSNMDGSMASRETFNHPDIGPSTSRRHSHAPRPLNPAIPPSGYLSPYGSAPDQNARQRELAALLQDRAVHRHHRHHASMGNFSTMPRYRGPPGSYTPMQPPPPPSVRTQLREEDECPICHQALPPKGPDNSEVAREAHVQSCIETHFSSSAPRSSDPPPSAAPGAAVQASATTLSQAIGSQPVPPGHRASVSSNDMPSASSQQRRRVAGMLVYQASEKDCVGEDGQGAQECVICFEEFAVGDDMGRLECLCKFHKTCIRQWWETKGPGACPVHQEGT